MQKLYSFFLFFCIFSQSFSALTKKEYKPRPGPNFIEARAKKGKPTRWRYIKGSSAKLQVTFAQLREGVPLKAARYLTLTHDVKYFNHVLKRNKHLALTCVMMKYPTSFFAKKFFSVKDFESYAARNRSFLTLTFFLKFLHVSFEKKDIFKKILRGTEVQDFIQNWKLLKKTHSTSSTHTLNQKNFPDPILPYLLPRNSYKAKLKSLNIYLAQLLHYAVTHDYLGLIDEKSLSGALNYTELLHSSLYHEIIKKFLISMQRLHNAISPSYLIICKLFELISLFEKSLQNISHRIELTKNSLSYFEYAYGFLLSILNKKDGFDDIYLALEQGFPKIKAYLEEIEKQEEFKKENSKSKAWNLYKENAQKLLDIHHYLKEKKEWINSSLAFGKESPLPLSTSDKVVQENYSNNTHENNKETISRFLTILSEMKERDCKSYGVLNKIHNICKLKNPSLILGNLEDI